MTEKEVDIKSLKAIATRLEHLAVKIKNKNICEALDIEAARVRMIAKDYQESSEVLICHPATVKEEKKEYMEPVV